MPRLMLVWIGQDLDMEAAEEAIKNRDCFNCELIFSQVCNALLIDI